MTKIRPDQEYIRCYQDPLYFITKYIKIEQVPRPYQEEMIDKMLTKHRETNHD